MPSSRFTIFNSFKGAALFFAFAVVVASGALLRSKHFHQPSPPPGVTEEREGPPPPEYFEQKWGGFTNPSPVAKSELAAVSAPPSNWQPLGPIQMVDPGSTVAYEPSFGRLNCLAIDPGNPNRLFAGAGSGGLWASSDGGQTWSPRTDNLPVLGVNDVKFDSQNANIIYLATGDADGSATPSVGVYKSTDGGLTWNATGLVFDQALFKKIYKLAVHPTVGGKVYAGSSDGIYVTSDGGANWTLTKPQGPNSSATYFDIQFRPGSASVLYAVASGGRFFRSTDSGANWTQITTGLPTAAQQIGRSAIGITAADPMTVYVLCSNGNGNDLNGIYRSTDGGTSFSLAAGTASAKTGFGAQGGYDLCMAVSPTNASELYIGGVAPLRSTNAGASWNTIRGTETPYTQGKSITHVDVHDLKVAGSSLFACTDGGLHRTTDAGAHWTDLSRNLAVAQIYHFSNTEQDGGLIYTGEQDNGLDRLMNGKWEHVRAGDFAQPLIDPTNSSVVYASSNGGVAKTTDGWATTYQALQITTETAKFGGPVLAINPANTQILYAGFKNIFKTTNGGTNWSPVTTFTDGAVCQVIAVAPSDPRVVYAARRVGSTGAILIRSPDSGATWTDISTGHLPRIYVTGIAIDPQNPNRVWVSLEGGQGAVVYQTDDAPAMLWGSFSGSLPNLAANTIVYQAGSQDALYVGMSVGVFYRDATMSDWAPFMTNFPNAIVNDLQINFAAGKVRAATYGRGAWETNLPNAPVKNSLLNISTRLQVGTGDNVLIAGFILIGNGSKSVLFRAIGPSLAGSVPGAMTDPKLEFFSGTTSIGKNDNWKTTQIGGVITGDQAGAILASSVAPTNDAESAMIATLAPGNYTAVLNGANNSTGIAVVDGYDLSQSTAKVGNISTRGFVRTGDGAMIGGFIIGNQTINVVVRAIGPSLSAAGVPTPLANPTLELRDINGNLLDSNDNWKVRPDGTSQQAQIAATGVPPTNDLESALVHAVAPGNYTAIVRGVNNGVGNAVVEVYNLQ